MNVFLHTIEKELIYYAEVSNRIISVMVIWKNLVIFRKETQYNTRNNILIYNVIIQSIFFYVLEIIEIPVIFLSRLEFFFN
jgi:hypothetical protein